MDRYISGVRTSSLTGVGPGKVEVLVQFITSEPVKEAVTVKSRKQDIVIPRGQSVIVSCLACVASVSVLFRSKERPRNEILGFGRARNETRGKNERGGRGRGRPWELRGRQNNITQNIFERRHLARKPEWLRQCQIDERISSFVDTLLQPIAQKQKSFIRDTTDFISFIEKTKIGKNTILVSMDVSSLYIIYLKKRERK